MARAPRMVSRLGRLRQLSNGFGVFPLSRRELEFACFTEDSPGRAMETKRGREEEECMGDEGGGRRDSLFYPCNLTVRLLTINSNSTLSLFIVSMC